LEVVGLYQFEGMFVNGQGDRNIPVFRKVGEIESGQEFVYRKTLQELLTRFRATLSASTIWYPAS